MWPFKTKPKTKVQCDKCHHIKYSFRGYIKCYGWCNLELGKYINGYEWKYCKQFKQK